MASDEPLEVAERELLSEVIDCYLEGIKEAKEATTQDRTLGTAEELLDVQSGYAETIQQLERIRGKLCLAQH